MALTYDYGIDFGTTNSTATAFDTTGGYNSVQFYEYHDGKQRPIPSVVAIDSKTGKVAAVGREAWNKRQEFEETCEYISSVKSLLGDETWNKRIGRKNWNVEGLARLIFLELIKSAESLEGDMRKATIAIPVDLDSDARKMLRHAAESAGIDVESFISESTAAFFADYEDLRSAESVAVFDWGGGTLDVSVLSHKRGRISEIATNNLRKAGDVIDRMIAERVHANIAHDFGLDRAFEDMDPRDQDALVVTAERAKIAMSTRDRYEMVLYDYGGLETVDYTVEYGWFSENIAKLIDEAMECFDTALSQAGKTPASIDRVILVGGSSNLRPLRDRMLERFGDRLYLPEKPEWSISKGAAQLSHYRGKYYAAQDVGLILADGSYYPLLVKGECVNDWKKSIYFGVTDVSETVRVIFSGSADIDDEPGHRQVLEVPGYRFLEERLLLEAEVTKDLIFKVSMRSTMRPKRDMRVWSYRKLKLTYEIGAGSW